MMTTSLKPYYCPALRMKGGELLGIRDLAPDIADRVRPRLIVPPPADRDDALQGQLFEGEIFPDISTALATHWSRRPALVEATYLIDEFGRDRMGLWFPRMFEKARAAGACPIPLVTLDDLLAGSIEAYRAAIDSSQPVKFGIVISMGHLADDELVKRVIDRLGRLGLSSEDCSVIADFHDADFTNPELVAPIIGGVLDTLHAAAPWHQVVFQGTNYPEKNPADAGGKCLVPRNEWIAWKRAVGLNTDTANQMIFGDYAADCAKIEFTGGGGAPAIRHHRYATPEAWLVQRGADLGTHFATMRAVCKAIVDSGMFAGRDFSVADERIFQMSQGNGRPGAAREWRAVNTTHHITRVVTDVGNILGLRFARVASLSNELQLELLSGPE